MSRLSSAEEGQPQDAIKHEQATELVPRTFERLVCPSPDPSYVAALLRSKVLHTIHKAFNTYANRFPTTPTYQNEIDLPLPFANAIQNLGVYTVNYYNLVSVHPENIQNEGKTGTDQIWDNNNSDHQYESCINVLKDLGIPLKCVDIEAKRLCMVDSASGEGSWNSGLAMRSITPIMML